MTLEEAIKHAEEVAKEQEELYRLCPASESEISRCDGTKDCKTLKSGKNKGCQKCAKEHRQLAEWLKDYKRLLEQENVLDKIRDEIDAESMNGAICYCGAKMDIDKMLESGGMDGSYRNWILRCPRCGIVKKYAADGFYGREYFSTIEDVINEWNRNKAMSYRLSANTEVNKNANSN